MDDYNVLVKALTVRQPWASLILSGIKTIELRTWKTNYRGPVIICSSANKKHESGVLLGLSTKPLQVAPASTALCIVDIIDCRPATPEDRIAACCEPSSKEFAWLISKPQKITQFQVKGSLGLFNLDLPVIRRFGGFIAISDNGIHWPEPLEMHKQFTTRYGYPAGRETGRSGSMPNPESSKARL